MKYFVIIFFMSLSFSITTEGQGWAPLGAKWHFSNDIDLPPGSQYFTWEVIGDTMIQNTACKIIERVDFRVNGISIVSDSIFTYSQNDSVYYYNYQETFVLLYDFTAQVGDTIALPQDSSEISITDLLVDSIKIIESNGIAIKDFYISPLNNNWTGNNRYTEKVGTFNSLFPDVIFVAANLPSLRCYEDEEVFLNFTSQACDFWLSTSVIENSVKPIRSIFPNPVSTIITIELHSKIKDGQYKLRTISGQTIFQANITNTNRFKIDISSVPSGIYLLELTDSNFYWTEKLVKQ